MTRKQHRKNKEIRLANKNNYPESCQDRPEWADFEKEESSFETWRQNFLKELNMAVKLRMA